MVAEHGFGARAQARSLPAGRRPRSREGRASALPDIRAGPAGEQERQEWLDALQDVKERVTTLENVQRSHAQSIAGNSSLINEVNLKLGNATEDIANYKTYLQGCLFSDTTSVQNSFNVLDKKVYEFTKLLTDVLQVKMAATDEKLQVIQTSLDELSSQFAGKEDKTESQPAPQCFDIQAQLMPTPAVGESTFAEPVYVGRPVNPQDVQRATLQAQGCQTSPFIAGQVVEQQPAVDPLQTNDC